MYLLDLKPEVEDREDAQSMAAPIFDIQYHKRYALFVCGKSPICESPSAHPSETVLVKKQPQADVGDTPMTKKSLAASVTSPSRVDPPRLGHVPHVAAACPVDVVAEGDQGVRRQADPVKAGEICPAFLCRDR